MKTKNWKKNKNNLNFKLKTQTQQMVSNRQANIIKQLDIIKNALNRQFKKKEIVKQKKYTTIQIESINQKQQLLKKNSKIVLTQRNIKINKNTIYETDKKQQLTVKQRINNNNKSKRSIKKSSKNFSTKYFPRKKQQTFIIKLDDINFYLKRKQKVKINFSNIKISKQFQQKIQRKQNFWQYIKIERKSFYVKNYCENFKMQLKPLKFQNQQLKNIIEFNNKIKQSINKQKNNQFSFRYNNDQFIKIQVQSQPLINKDFLPISNIYKKNFLKNQFKFNEIWINYQSQVLLNENIASIDKQCMNVFQSYSYQQRIKKNEVKLILIQRNKKKYKPKTEAILPNLQQEQKNQQLFTSRKIKLKYTIKNNHLFIQNKNIKKKQQIKTINQQEIIYLINQNHTNKLQQLLKTGFNKQKSAQYLIYAVQQRNTQCLQVMLNYMNIDSQDFLGNTALHKAIELNYNQIIDFLICRNANELLMNEIGKIPWDYLE